MRDESRKAFRTIGRSGGPIRFCEALLKGLMCVAGSFWQLPQWTGDKSSAASHSTRPKVFVVGTSAASIGGLFRVVCCSSLHVNLLAHPQDYRSAPSVSVCRSPLS